MGSMKEDYDRRNVDREEAEMDWWDQMREEQMNDWEQEARAGIYAIFERHGCIVGVPYRSITTEILIFLKHCYAKGEAAGKIKGLERGAEITIDHPYMTDPCHEPCDICETVVRYHAALRKEAEAVREG